MRTPERAALVALLGLVLGLEAGCARNTAPHGWLPGVKETPQETRGAWVTVTRVKPLEPRRIHGELLGVGDSSLVVLAYREEVGTGGRSFSQWEVKTSPVPAAPVAISYREVQEVKVTFYRAPEAGMAVWAAIGTVGTLSHGVGLILSAPVWIIVGTASTSGVSHEPEAKARTPERIRELRKFARFPQGMPAGVAITAVADRE